MAIGYVDTDSDSPVNLYHGEVSFLEKGNVKRLVIPFFNCQRDNNEVANSEQLRKFAHDAVDNLFNCYDKDNS